MAVTVCAFLSVAVSPYPALGNSESSNLILLGVQDLQVGKFKRAMQLIEKAACVDPTDSQAIFFQGMGSLVKGQFHY